MGCSRPWIMRLKQLSTLMTVIQLWQITWGADPPSMIQKEVKVCFNCNETTADFNWMHKLKPLYRIQWKFKDVIMCNYTKTELNITQESLTIRQEYKGRFHLLQPGGVGFSLSSVTTADIGTYRCIILLKTAVVETLEGVLEEIERKNMVEICSHENAVFNWTLRNEQSFSLIQWQFNGTTFASTTKKGLSSDSLDIIADYKARFSLLHPGDVGFQLDNVRREDTGTYTCIITSQSGGFTIEGDLEVIDQQSGNFRISVNRTQKTLTCGYCRESMYSWIFANTTEIQNVSGEGCELRLPSIPQKGSVYCLQHSDCRRSLLHKFSSDEVSEEGGNNISIEAVVIPIVGTIAVAVAVAVALLYRKRFRRITGGRENVSEADENMLKNINSQTSA